MGAKIRELTTFVFESTDARFLCVRNGSVYKFGSRPLPSGLIVDGLITDAIKMGDVISEIVRENGLDTKYVITALSGLRSIPRLLTMPNLQASMLREAISREARKEMPVSLEDLYLSWQAMPVDDERQRIYLLGVPREMIDAQVRALEAAGVRPWVMDLKPLALIRSVRQPQAIIVNLEQDMLDIILVVDAWPAIMRTFALKNQGLDEQGHLDRLLNELMQTVRFYNEGHRAAPIAANTSVYVTGKLLGKAEHVAYLRNVIDRPVEVPPAPLPAPVNLPVAEYMTNMGLAMKKV
ncbi:MAG: pilus assembly protein PilM, partial [Chloroflexi bacterium]|nr:pilus assembly protein PilM [Chloroflexota bacterium]